MQLPISGQFTSLIRPVSMSNGKHVGYFWKGSAFAQIYLHTDSPEPVEITGIALEGISDAEIEEMKKQEAARRLAEEQRIRPYGHTKIFKEEANCWEFNNVFNVWAGIAQKSIEKRAAQVLPHAADTGIKRRAEAYAAGTLQPRKGNCALALRRRTKLSRQGT